MTTTNTQTEIDEIIARMLFSDPRELDTRAGKRLLKCARIAENVRGDFWDSWKVNQSAWKGRGFSVSKYGGDWQLCQWLNPDGTLTEQSKEAAERAKEEEGDPNALPAEWIPDDVKLTSPQSAKLLPYQSPAVLRLKRALSQGNALDASDTGTGKTFCALVAAAELGLTPCVIAPLAVLPSWQRAAAMLGVRLGWLINYDKIRNGKSGLGKWLRANCDDADDDGNGPGKKFKFEFLPANAVIIFDECQKCKSPDTLQGQLLRDAARDGNKVLCLSATAAKDPTEMRNLGAALALHDGTRRGWAAWCYKNGCKDGTYGMKFPGNGVGKKFLERIHRTIFPLKGNRIRVADLPDFPETQILAEALDTGNTDFITRAYAEMDATLAKIEADSGLSGSQRSSMGLAAIMKARVAAEKGKLPLFQDLAEEAIEEGRSVVIFLNFRECIESMMKALKADCVVWGGQKPDERQRNIDRFNSDESRVIIVSLQAGGAGLSLHDLNGNFARLALLSPSYSAIDLKQGLGRVHRAGAKTKSFQRIIFAAGTIEEEICVSIREKLTNIDTLNDGHLAPQNILRHVKLTGANPAANEPF